MALLGDLDGLLAEFGVPGVSATVLTRGGLEDMCAGVADKATSRPMTTSTWLEFASLSKTVAAAFLCEAYAEQGTPLDTSVNALLAQTTSPFRLRSAEGCDPAWADEVTLAHLVNHTALGMHYVFGFPPELGVPDMLVILEGRCALYGHEPLRVQKKPGSAFSYSGGGFLTLQHLLEANGGKPIEELMRDFLDTHGMQDCRLDNRVPDGTAMAHGHTDRGEEVLGTRLAFPALAAGALGTPRALATFLRRLVGAYAGEAGEGLSRVTARAMLDSPLDLGAKDFMNAEMGLGVFVARAGPNRIAIHQAANDGFRGVYLVCFDGPDAGKGIVALANGDNQAALMLAELLRRYLLAAEWQGIDRELLRGRGDFSTHGVAQAEIVNQAYKRLVFEAFLPLPQSSL